MKFEHDGDDRRAVAFIDEDGDLCIKSDDGDAIWLTSYGAFDSENRFDLVFADSDVVRKLYPGDKITITF